MSDILNETIEQIKAYCDHSIDLLALDQTFQKYMAADQRYRDKNAGYLSAESLHIINMSLLESTGYYYILSFLLQATRQEAIYLALLKRSISDEQLSIETKYFLYDQFTCYNFLNAALLSDAVLTLYDELYNQIYHSYLREIEDEYVMIPKEQRNPDLVFAFTSQILGMEHGPTKTLLDRCYVLAESLHKKVCIINTAELLSNFQSIPFFDTKVGSYIEEYTSLEYLTYRSKTFAFLQCPREMPQIPIIQGILSVIKSEKPYFIITVGANSIVSDICGNIVPTLTIGTGQMDRLKKWRPFQTVIGTAGNRNQYSHMEQDQVIESLFTFSFKPQAHSFSRKELDLPAERFIVLLVGYRLDDEIDTEFLELLRRLIDTGIYVVFVGNLHKYQKMIEVYPQFQNNTSLLGLQDDTLAVNECCDLYLNPKRAGGGTSAAEALAKGLPVVTLDYGDVAICAGEDFQVSDYEEMYKKVIKYSTDRKYYNTMSQKAIDRAKILTDSEKEFTRIIHIMEQSPRF